MFEIFRFEGILLLKLLNYVRAKRNTFIGMLYEMACPSFRKEPGVHAWQRNKWFNNFLIVKNSKHAENDTSINIYKNIFIRS